MTTTDYIGGYRLLHRLGAGGAGTVWLAEDAAGARVALKLIHPALAASDEQRERLLRETRIVNSVPSNGVAHVLDIEIDDIHPFVVTEYIDGPSLAQLLAGGPLTPRDVAALARSLYETLSAVHAAKVVHRDVKPSNIVCARYGPVLIDFGIAIAQGEQRLTTTGLLSGTAGFTSPELLRGDEAAPASDWWALAATLLNAATGRPPFGRGAAAHVLDRVMRGDADFDGLPSALVHPLAAALDPQIDRRMAPEAMVAELEAAAGRQEGTVVWTGIPQPQAPIVEATDLHAVSTPFGETEPEAVQSQGASVTELLSSSSDSAIDQTEALGATPRSPQHVDDGTPVDDGTAVLPTIGPIQGAADAHTPLGATSVLPAVTSPPLPHTPPPSGTQMPPSGTQTAVFPQLHHAPAPSPASRYVHPVPASVPSPSPSPSPSPLAAPYASNGPLQYGQINTAPHMASSMPPPATPQGPYIPRNPAGSGIVSAALLAAAATVPVISGLQGTLIIGATLVLIALVGALHYGREMRRFSYGSVRSSDWLAMFAALPLRLIQALAATVFSAIFACLAAAAVWWAIHFSIESGVTTQGVLTLGPWSVSVVPPLQWPLELVGTHLVALGIDLWITSPVWFLAVWFTMWVLLLVMWLFPSSTYLRRGANVAFEYLLPTVWLRFIAGVLAVVVVLATWLIVTQS
ncbi:serine/threonine-protein kinase [Schaalia suimastitidis]|uniref:serine/threonine-protein kinase n=1 Tax=Schaalia suimastitidis TaxID=121163 RepID=UPI00041659B9|nr:serine/threonine-protein kinase [Schaalia suimastitidis]